MRGASAAASATIARNASEARATGRRERRLTKPGSWAAGSSCLRLLTNVSAPAVTFASSHRARPRVQPAVGEVDGEIDEDDDQGKADRGALNERDVVLQGSLDGEVSEPG